MGFSVSLVEVFLLHRLCRKASSGNSGYFCLTGFSVRLVVVKDETNNPVTGHFEGTLSYMDVLRLVQLWVSHQQPYCRMSGALTRFYLRTVLLIS